MIRNCKRSATQSDISCNSTQNISTQILSDRFNTGGSPSDDEIDSFGSSLSQEDGKSAREIKTLEYSQPSQGLSCI